MSAVLWVTPNKMLDSSLRFFCYDCVTVFFLALFIALRGRMSGEPPIGCLLLALISALLWPVARELVLHGSCLAVFAANGLLAAALLGAVLGALAPMLNVTVAHYLERLQVYSEILGLSLACCFGLLCALPRLPASGALLLSLLLTVLPSTFADVALGDVARLVTASARIWRALLGAIASCALLVFLPQSMFAPLPADLLALALGLALPLLLQRLWPR